MAQRLPTALALVQRSNQGAPALECLLQSRAARACLALSA
jgi:hypothetical protein